MTTFMLRGADPSVLLHHMAFYGLADILETAGVEDALLVWDDGWPVLAGEKLSPERVEDAVRDHILGRRHWVDATTGREQRAVMSPRLTVFKSHDDWRKHQDDRERVLGELTDQHAWPDLRYLAALGEPCYWRHSRVRGDPLQDDAASRLEMQPRNRGSEFVGNRLRPLTAKLLARKPGQIAAGLAGTGLVDELGGKPDSVSATGLATPGPVDNAVVWCALWGIGQFPTMPRTAHAAVTSGHLGRPRREWFYVPVWERPWRPARLRSILASSQLARAAHGLPQTEVAALNARAAATWLSARGVVGVVRFPIGRFGSDNAPERRALRGEVIPL